MRPLWVLVVVCLVAAPAARPLSVERLEPHAAHLDAAPVSLAVVARRQAPHLPELRLAAFVLAQAPAVEVAPVISASQLERSANPVDACATETTCARGPPSA